MTRPLAAEALPSATAPSRRTGRPNKDWLRIWLACAAFYYPTFWFSNSVVWAMPALARIALFGHRLNGLTLTPFGAVASSMPPETTGTPQPHWTAHSPYSLVMTVALVLLATLVLALVGRRARALSGLAIAMLGNVALASWLRRLFQFHGISTETVLGAIFFFAVLCFGLRWMLTGWNGSALRSRLGNLFAGFVLLPVLPWVWFSLVRGYQLWPYALMLITPSAAAAILMSLRPASPGTSQPQWTGWKMAGLGVVTFALLIVGVREGQSAIERARHAATRAAMAAYPKIPASLPYPAHFFQKGVSLSAEGWGGYESESARRMLETLHDYGVNAVALVPYGFAPRNRPEVRINSGSDSWESDEGLEQMSRVAHALGMKVMLKPGIWVGGGSFAGELDFRSPAERAKWFDEYARFVEHYARLATHIHADLFCVGGEFEKLTPYEADWRKLIARARQLYPGPLVYAANWGDEFERVRFWDALDYIGLQEYYPLPDDLSTDAVVQKVEAVQQRYQRPVIFTEVGFASAAGANSKPWENGRGAKLAPGLQARCYQAVFKAFYDKPWFEGMYWWKVGTNGFGGPEDTSLTPWDKPAMEVLKRWYTQAER